MVRNILQRLEGDLPHRQVAAADSPVIHVQKLEAGVAQRADAAVTRHVQRLLDGGIIGQAKDADDPPEHLPQLAHHRAYGFRVRAVAQLLIEQHLRALAALLVAAEQRGLDRLDVLGERPLVKALRPALQLLLCPAGGAHLKEGERVQAGQAFKCWGDLVKAAQSAAEHGEVEVRAAAARQLTPVHRLKDIVDGLRSLLHVRRFIARRQQKDQQLLPAVHVHEQLCVHPHGIELRENGFCIALVQLQLLVGHSAQLCVAAALHACQAEPDAAEIHADRAQLPRLKAPAKDVLVLPVQHFVEDVGTAHLLFIKNQRIGKAFHPAHPFLP